MRIPEIGLLVALLLNGSVDWYLYCFLKSRFSSRIPALIQLCTAVLLLAGLVSFFFLPVKSYSDACLRALMWVIFIYISVYVPKYIFMVFDLIARIPQLWRHRKLTFVTWSGAILGVIIFLSLWWGALFNRFNIEVKDVDVAVKDLPSAFEGFKIAQISDLHVGTYGNDTVFVSRLVDEINSLHPDVVLFTGDIVNRHTDELLPFTAALSRIKAPLGVYSVLGNHDYGDYYEWPDSMARERNNKRLADMQAEMGWRMLNNDFAYLTARNDTIVLIGVENIGDPPFHIYGNLQKAYPATADSKVKILMSHNPAHWVKDIADNPDFNIPLTLSGHTHAMQMTFFGYSPASMRYKTWGGLYSDSTRTHQLYVNIGTGTVGFPARLGATPEITLITLHNDGIK